jgi:uncharacterized membrane protein
VPRRDIIELDIPVEAAAKLIMSAGLIQPEGDQQKRLSAFAEAARAARARNRPKETVEVENSLVDPK